MMWNTHIIFNLSYLIMIALHSGVPFSILKGFTSAFTVIFIAPKDSRVAVCAAVASAVTVTLVVVALNDKAEFAELETMFKKAKLLGF